MSRSNYSDDCEYLDLYRASVDRAIKGRRGQSFLRELALEMDRMPEKKLVANVLIDPQGQCCTIGVLFKARRINVEAIDYNNARQIGEIAGIARSMAAEIEFENDDDECYAPLELPQERWVRMREWVTSNLR